MRALLGGLPPASASCGAPCLRPPRHAVQLRSVWAAHVVRQGSRERRASAFVCACCACAGPCPAAQEGLRGGAARLAGPGGDWRVAGAGPQGALRLPPILPDGELSAEACRREREAADVTKTWAGRTRCTRVGRRSTGSARSSWRAGTRPPRRCRACAAACRASPTPSTRPPRRDSRRPSSPRQRPTSTRGRAARSGLSRARCAPSCLQQGACAAATRCVRRAAPPRAFACCAAPREPLHRPRASSLHSCRRCHRQRNAAPPPPRALPALVPALPPP